MRCGAAVAFGAALACASAAVGNAKTIVANLDSDSASERVVALQLCESTDGTLHLPKPDCAEDQIPRRRIEIDDTCASAPYRRVISSVQDTVDTFRVTEADGTTARPEIFFDMRSGATGRGGDVRVVRYDDRPEASCPVPHRLFRYPSSATRGQVPRGASGRDSFSIFLRNYSRRRRGRELRVVETYVDRNDAFCCPSFERVSFFSFSRKSDRYVRFRTKVRRRK